MKGVSREIAKFYKNWACSRKLQMQRDEKVNITFSSTYVSEYSASVSYTHLRAHETRHDIVCRLLLEPFLFLSLVSSVTLFLLVCITCGFEFLLVLCACGCCLHLFTWFWLFRRVGLPLFSDFDCSCSLLPSYSRFARFLCSIALLHNKKADG